MKKLISLSLAVLCAAVLVPQTLSAGVGVKAGLNFANVSVKPSAGVPDLQNVTGTTAGFYFSLGLGPIAVQPEFLYSRRGFAYEQVDVGKLEYLNDYLEVPVLVKFTFMPGILRPFVFGGPSFGWRFHSAGRLTASGGTVTVDTPGLFKKFETAAVFGAGVEFKLLMLKLSVDARYHLGLTDIATAEWELESMKNNGLSVLVGVGF